jgi:Fe-S oxidoreductase
MSNSKENNPRGLFGGEQLPMVDFKMSESSDRPRKASDLSLIGLTAPVSDGERVIKSLKYLHEIKQQFRSLILYMDLCTKCGACNEACHWYLGTKDSNNIPAVRADLLRKIYRRYFSVQGKIFGSAVGADDLTNELIEKWFKYFYQCNECRRCAYICPFGIDTAEITIAARQILTRLGLVPEGIMAVAKNMQRHGNNMGIPPKAVKDIVSFMEKELREKTGKKIEIPIDREGAEVLHNPSSSEFFVTLDTLEGTATMFHAAGIEWTISSEIIETANFGLFFDFKTMKAHNNKLFDIARKLKSKRIVAGECGHGWRTWKMFSSQLSDASRIPIVHAMDECLNYIKKGAIKFDKTVNSLPVTLHDPCNMARAAGYIEQPRQVLRNLVDQKLFVEMLPNRERNFCCTGGSGQVTMDELTKLKAQAGLVKAQQVKATGAKWLIAPCAICKAELPRIMAHYGLDVEVHGLQDLVGYATVL